MNLDIGMKKVVGSAQESQQQVAALADCVISSDLSFDKETRIELAALCDDKSSVSKDHAEAALLAIIIDIMTTHGVLSKLNWYFDNLDEEGVSTKAVRMQAAKLIGKLMRELATPLVKGDGPDSLRNTTDGAEFELDIVLDRIQKGFVKAAIRQYVRPKKSTKAP